MPPGRETRRRSVFLNVPFDKSYEPLFVALICVLVALGRIPRCVLEIPDTGQGRLARILRLIRSCSVSMNDLSRVGLPVRFNMPFETGIAVALCRPINGNYRFVLMESRRYRLEKTLSDLKGIDPGIHGATPTGIISCVLSVLGRPSGNPSVKEVKSMYRELWKAVPPLRGSHGRRNVFSRVIFRELVEGAIRLAKAKGLVKE